MSTRPTLAPTGAPDGLAHFVTLYDESRDPWDTCNRWYERRKRALVLASLQRERYARAFEPACGSGALTRELAHRCENLLACDGVPAAAHALAQELRAERGVRVGMAILPHGWPILEANFDLIVLSEFCYYLQAPELSELLARCASSLAPGGELLACHYLPDFEDRRLPTEAIHAQIETMQIGEHWVRHRDHEFLLDVWVKP